ncbi:MAG: cupin domain-containing protein [Acidobacteriaceae bacterium]
MVQFDLRKIIADPKMHAGSKFSEKTLLLATSAKRGKTGFETRANSRSTNGCVQIGCVEKEFVPPHPQTQRSQNGGGQAEDQRMTLTKIILVVVCLMSTAVIAQEAKVTPLMSKDLTECPGKEGVMITVEYPPGHSDEIHRHNAYAFVYVLEGSVVMQVRGGKELTMTPGQTFYEGPDDIHLIGRNASKTKPAKFVVFFVKTKGAPILVPAK